MCHFHFQTKLFLTRVSARTPSNRPNKKREKTAATNPGEIHFTRFHRFTPRSALSQQFVLLQLANFVHKRDAPRQMRSTSSAAEGLSRQHFLHWRTGIVLIFVYCIVGFMLSTDLMFHKIASNRELKISAKIS